MAGLENEVDIFLYLTILDVKTSGIFILEPFIFTWTTQMNNELSPFKGNFLTVIVIPLYALSSSVAPNLVISHKAPMCGC